MEQEEEKDMRGHTFPTLRAIRHWKMRANNTNNYCCQIYLFRIHSLPLPPSPLSPSPPSPLPPSLPPSLFLKDTVIKKKRILPWTRRSEPPFRRDLAFLSTLNTVQNTSDRLRERERVREGGGQGRGGGEGEKGEKEEGERGERGEEHLILTKQMMQRWRWRKGYLVN